MAKESEKYAWDDDKTDQKRANVNDPDRSDVIRELTADRTSESLNTVLEPGTLYNDIIIAAEKMVKEDRFALELAVLVHWSTYTDSPLNLYMAGEGGIGKTWIAEHASKFFPEDDLIKLKDASPTSFKYTAEEIEGSDIRVQNFEHKIIIFLDNITEGLFKNLRAVLSHDTKEMMSQVTAKGAGGASIGMKIQYIGWPSTIWCTADSFNYDEQFYRRFLITTPNLTAVKISAALAKLDQKNFADILLGSQNKDEHTVLMARVKEVTDLIKNKAVKTLLPHGTAYLFPQAAMQEASEKAKFDSIVKSHAIAHIEERYVFEWNRQFFVIAQQEDYQKAYDIFKELEASIIYSIPRYLLRFYAELKKMVKAENLDIFEGGDIKAYYRNLKRPLATKTMYDNLSQLRAAGFVERTVNEQDRRKALYIMKDVEIKGGYLRPLQKMDNKALFIQQITDLRDAMIFSKKATSLADFIDPDEATSEPQLEFGLHFAGEVLYKGDINGFMEILDEDRIKMFVYDEHIKRFKSRKADRLLTKQCKQCGGPVMQTQGFCRMACALAWALGGFSIKPTRRYENK